MILEKGKWYFYNSYDEKSEYPNHVPEEFIINFNYIDGKYIFGNIYNKSIVSGKWFIWYFDNILVDDFTDLERVDIDFVFETIGDLLVENML